MSDNFTGNPGAGGDVFAADDVLGIKYQRVKLVLGADGANDGDVASGNAMPVTAAALPLPTGAATAANQQTNALTDTQLRAAAVPVSLASTTVTGSVAVTGPLTDTQLRLTAVPVSLTSTTITGTVAATQSGTWNIGSITTLPALAAGANAIGSITNTSFAATQATAASLNATVVGTGTFAVQATLAAETTKVIGTVNVAAGQTIATTNAGTFAVQAAATLAAETTKVIGTGNIAAAQTLATVTTVGAVTAITNALPTGTNSIGTVQSPTLTKATQGATGVTTQDLKDAGRSARTISLDSFAVAATTETLNTMSYSTDNGTLTTGTSYTVTTAKRLRIQAITVSLHTIAGNTTAVAVIVRLRVNNAGAAIVTSPVQLIVPLPGMAAANGATAPVLIDVPDGWEFVAGAGIGITTICAGFVATTAAPKVNISIIGYEY